MLGKWIYIGILLLWIISMWGLICYAMWRGWGPWVRSKRQRKEAVQAKVAKKQGRHEFDPISWQAEYTQKVLVFECEDGVERDYEVHDDIWDWVEIGDDGILTFQGHIFVRFDARRPRHDLEKLYNTLTRS